MYLRKKWDSGESLLIAVLDITNDSHRKTMGIQPGFTGSHKFNHRDHQLHSTMAIGIPEN